MSDEVNRNNDSGAGQPERVGRVIIDYGDPDRIAEDRRDARGDRLGFVVLAGIIAILLMVGALLLILPGVFEV